jgi:hypothetical protein
MARYLAIAEHGWSATCTPSRLSAMSGPALIAARAFSPCSSLPCVARKEDWVAPAFP